MRPSFAWYGGKALLASKLLKLIPPHRVYVEPFGGSAALLFAKPPSPVEVYNDIDSGLVNFFRVLRDPEKFERFYRLVSLTPYSREEYYHCRETWEECEDDVERAYRWFVVARMSFSGRFGDSWSYSVTASSRGMSNHCSRWLNTIDMLPQVHARVMRVQVEHRDFRDVFAAYDTPETLFYVDPPYVPDTRRERNVYRYELTLDDHKELVDILLKIKGMALLSGYCHPVYEPLERAGWQRLDYDTVCWAAGRTRGTGILGKDSAKKTQARTESVWVSPNAHTHVAALL